MPQDMPLNWLGQAGMGAPKRQLCVQLVLSSHGRYGDSWEVLTATLCHLQFGVIVLTTSNGIMDHEEARRKKVGGKVRKE